MMFVVCTIVSGALFYLSQGMADFWPLAWIAAAPLLWLAYRSARWRAPFLASMSAFALGQIYLFQCYDEFMPVAIVGAQVLILALMFGAAVVFAQAVYKRIGAFAALLAFPALWTAFEYLWGSISPNGTFAALGYSQVSAPFLIQSASLFGLAGVTFLICLFSNAIALAAREERGARFAAAVGFSVCMLNGGFGVIRLAKPHPDELRVAALADHSDTVAAYGPKDRAGDVKLASVYADAIRGAAAQGARLAVTAEGGILTSSDWRDAVFAPLAAVAKDAHIEIVAGIAQRDPPADIAVAFHPDGRRQRYAKRHLVPGLEAQFTPGRAPGLLGDKRAVVICKDMDFPATIRSDAQNDIRVMAVPAGDFLKDGWIHARMSIMRGVENGFAVVRAANQGLVTVSDAEGRVIARKVYQRRGVYSVVADVPPGPGPTLYTRIGDVFSWAAIVLVILLGGLSLRVKSRA